MFLFFQFFQFFEKLDGKTGQTPSASFSKAVFPKVEGDVSVAYTPSNGEKLAGKAGRFVFPNEGKHNTLKKVSQCPTNARRAAN